MEVAALQQDSETEGDIPPQASPPRRLPALEAARRVVEATIARRVVEANERIDAAAGAAPAPSDSADAAPAPSDSADAAPAPNAADTTSPAQPAGATPPPSGSADAASACLTATVALPSSVPAGAAIPNQPVKPEELTAAMVVAQPDKLMSIFTEFWSKEENLPDLTDAHIPEPEELRFWLKHKKQLRGRKRRKHVNMKKIKQDLLKMAHSVFPGSCLPV
jgi:hypothetical protein